MIMLYHVEFLQSYVNVIIHLLYLLLMVVIKISRNNHQLLDNLIILLKILQLCNCCSLRFALKVMVIHRDLIQHRVKFIKHVRFNCIIIYLYVVMLIFLSMILLLLVSFRSMHCCPNEHL